MDTRLLSSCNGRVVQYGLYYGHSENFRQLFLLTRIILPTRNLLCLQHGTAHCAHSHSIDPTGVGADLASGAKSGACLPRRSFGRQPTHDAPGLERDGRDLDGRGLRSLHIALGIAALSAHAGLESRSDGKI